MKCPSTRYPEHSYWDHQSPSYLFCNMHILFGLQIVVMNCPWTRYPWTYHGMIQLNLSGAAVCESCLAHFGLRPVQFCTEEGELINISLSNLKWNIWRMQNSEHLSTRRFAELSLWHTVPKIRFIYSQKRNSAASFPIPTVMCLLAMYTGSVSLFCCSQICRPIQS